MADRVQEDVAALAERIAAACASGEPLRITGGGTWLDAGHPCAGTTLSVGAHAGVVDYEPADLTITARAGTTLEALEAVTAEHGQWLGLDPAARPGATIGATVATASDGPLAVSMGRMRDLVLGLECITGRGDIVRAGGRVVKNVAGFDLVRLHTGAWGTLGVITEVSLRLRARPEVDRAFVVARDDRVSLESRLAPLAELRLEPLLLELLHPSTASRIGVAETASPSGAPCLLVRLAGNATRVAAQRERLAAAGDVTEVPLSVCHALQTLEPARCCAARVSHMPTHVTNSWRHVLDHCSAHRQWQPLLRASILRGVVRVVLPLGDRERAIGSRTADSPAQDGLSPHTHEIDWGAFVRGMAPPGAHVSWERLPEAGWEHVPSAVSDPISRSLRRALDPAHILNRGVLGETPSEGSAPAGVSGAAAPLAAAHGSGTRP